MDTHDLAIANFRAAHEGALLDPSHAEHGMRVEELTGLHEQKAAGVPVLAASVPANIDTAIAEHRSKHSAALYDAGHPEHTLRTEELTRLFQSKFGEADQQDGKAAKLPQAQDPERAAEPAEQHTDYDFSGLRDLAPFGLEVGEDADLERWSREWLYAGGVSPAEGKALASVYAESMAWSHDQVQRMAEQTGRDLRIKYGADVGKVASAALRVADEMPELRIFLDNNQLLNHPRVIDNLIRTAERKGYIQRGNGQ